MRKGKPAPIGRQFEARYRCVQRLRAFPCGTQDPIFDLTGGDLSPFQFRASSLNVRVIFVELRADSHHFISAPCPS
ncbi:hypothetical protein ABTH71_20200, partial [Acinetobacter baumannii]